MLDARFSHILLYFCQSFYTLQRRLPVIAGLLVSSVIIFELYACRSM